MAVQTESKEQEMVLIKSSNVPFQQLEADGSQQDDIKEILPLACKSVCKQLEGKLFIFLAGFIGVSVFSLVKVVETIPVGQFSSSVFFFAALFSLPALFFKEKDIGFHGKAKYVIPRACIGGLAGVLMLWAAKRMDYGDSVALASLVPIFAAIFSRVLWKEKLSIFTILSLLVGLSGVVLIAKPSFLFGAPSEEDKKEYSPFFSLVPLFAGILLGFSFSLMRKVGTEVSPIFVTLFVTSAVVVEGIIFQFISGDKFVLPECFMDRLIMFLGGFGIFLYLILLNRGLTLEKSGPGVLIRNCDIVIAYGIQVVFFDSVPNHLSIIGALLVISSAVLVTINKLLIEKYFKYEV